MKHLLSAFLLLFAQPCFANMASPLREGTFTSAAFSSRNIDILNEKINIKIDNSFKTALFRIEYSIKTDTDGNQIPLLFHAVDYDGDFKVWVDNQLVNVTAIPAAYQSLSNSPFQSFSNIFNGSNEVTIYWEENSGFVYNLNDLKYFEASLSKGEHKISVEYTATAWLDLQQWVNHYSFRYSLSPAQFWKSFGSLEITLDATQFKKAIATNFGNPASGKLDSISVWTFSELPGKYLQIDFVPKLSSTAATLMSIGTSRLTLCFAIVIIILHLVFVRLFRKRNPQKKYSWVVMAGSILIPFAILCFNLYSYDIIDSAIGEAASHYHGYTFMIMLLYPILMPLYWVGMWLTDKFYRKKLLAS